MIDARLEINDYTFKNIQKIEIIKELGNENKI
jgi:hypothetical protein